MYMQVWSRTLRRLPNDTEEEKVVKQRLQEYITSLERDLDRPSSLQNLAELEQKYVIKVKVLGSIPTIYR